LASIPDPAAPKETGEENTEEEKKAIEKLAEEATAKNSETEKENEELEKIQSKVKIEARNHDYENNNECAVVRLRNFREPKAEEASKGLTITDVAEGDE
jgi:hypothetical protein